MAETAARLGSEPVGAKVLSKVARLTPLSREPLLRRHLDERHPLKAWSAQWAGSASSESPAVVSSRTAALPISTATGARPAGSGHGRRSGCPGLRSVCLCATDQRGDRRSTRGPLHQRAGSPEVPETDPELAGSVPSRCWQLRRPTQRLPRASPCDGWLEGAWAELMAGSKLADLNVVIAASISWLQRSR